MAHVGLTFVIGPQAGRTLTIPPAGAVLGRSRTADLQIEDESLSRRHCQVQAQPTPTLTDLGSSNGTLLNGKALEANIPYPLAAGDVVTLGDSVLRVEISADAPAAPQPQAPVAPAPVPPTPESLLFPPADAPLKVEPLPLPKEPAPAPAEPAAPLPSLFQTETTPQSVDLGLEEKPEEAPRKKGGLMLLIVALVVLLGGVLGAGLYFQELAGTKAPSAVGARRVESTDQQQFEFAYEHLAIDGKTLFRYRLTFDTTGELRLAIDDLGAEDRSFSKHQTLSPKAIAALRRELLEANYLSIGEIFPERSADGISVERKKLTIVFGAEVWTRTAENVRNRAFDALCDRLEQFGRNELGAHATQYSVEELRAMGQEQLQLAQRYWEQRDLGDEKLWHCVTAYRRGLSALETLNPKPAYAAELTSGLWQAEELLNERHEAETFAVEQAINIRRYDQAAHHLRRILRMIPDREDARNVTATEKLLSVENRFLKGGKH